MELNERVRACSCPLSLSSKAAFFALSACSSASAFSRVFLRSSRLRAQGTRMRRQKDGFSQGRAHCCFSISVMAEPICSRSLSSPSFVLAVASLSVASLSVSCSTSACVHWRNVHLRAPLEHALRPVLLGLLLPVVPFDSIDPLGAAYIGGALEI
eukprot:scaffold8290_cov62-Phaeocystis_antarctica.AAC.3